MDTKPVVVTARSTKPGHELFAYHRSRGFSTETERSGSTMASAGPRRPTPMTLS